MRMFLFLLLAATLGAQSAAQPLAESGGPLQIIDRPLRFDEERISLTIDYIWQHFGIDVDNIRIVPQAIVVHWTGGSSLAASWRHLNAVRTRGSRRRLQRGGALNFSAHFLVARDGTIYRLMPEDWMARHCIGLEYDAIGVENVADGSRFPLTDRQLAANAALVRYLAGKFPIRYLLGHGEWKRFEHAPFFRERDPTYRNAKADPGRAFMRQLRALVRELGLRDSPST